MQDLFKEIKEYLQTDFDDRIQRGGIGDSLIVAYDMQRFSECFRVQSKHLYGALMRACCEGGSLDVVRAKHKLALCLVQALLRDDRLVGKKDKCDALKEDDALAPFHELWDKDPKRLNKRAGAKAVLAQIERDLQDASTGMDKAGQLDVDSLRKLLTAMLIADERNKKFNAAQRLMELEEDALIVSLGKEPLSEQLSSEELEERRADDVQKFKNCIRNKSKRAGQLRKLFGFDLSKNSDDWWRGVIECPEKANPSLENLVLCMTAIYAVRFLDNVKSGRTTSFAIQLIEMYLARNGNGATVECLDQGQTKVDVTDLVSCMQDDAYRHAIIPLVVDARTGGGVYLMGQEQLRRQCHSEDAFGEFPPWACSLALVDYHLGNPAHDVGAKEFEGVVRHECRIVSPKKMGGIRLVPAFVATALTESQKAYEERSKRERAQSFWNSYTHNPSLDGNVPRNCPPRFQPYFGGYEKPRKSTDDLIDWESDMRGMQAARETVVPKCLMLYLDAERFEGMRLDSWYDEKALADGKASITFMDADRSMRELRDDYGIVDYYPCVARVWYTEDKWKLILSALLKTPGFRTHYLSYVAECGIECDPYEAPLDWLEREEVPLGVMRSVGKKAKELERRLMES